MWDRHRHRFTELAAFKQAIVAEWEAYPQETIAKAILCFVFAQSFKKIAVETWSQEPKFAIFSK